MWRVLLAIWFCLASATTAGAEQVSVQSGEHNGFTRLVLDFAAPVGWTMTRTDGGYRLALNRPDMRFDLTDVFRLIPRDRLSSIWADPEDGALMLGIGCSCHAFPFELRPDVLVIDLRDGPPPPGSSFELAENGTDMPPITARAPARPRSRPDTAAKAEVGGMQGYDWLDQAARTAALAPAPAAVPLPPSVVAAEGNAHAAQDDDVAAASKTRQAVDALRDDLLRQISNGAARGEVELAPHVSGQAERSPAATGHAPLQQIRIGGDVGLDPEAGHRPDHSLTAKGDRCLPDAAVDVASWGAETPVAETIALRTGALYGEFDRVDPAAAETAVKYLLHLGFGAEAQGLIDTLALEGPDVALWSALAKVADGALAPDSPLTGMEVCNGSVALWAVLARPDLSAGDRVQQGAILRAFSALPPHLRRHLGPALAARFMARGDAGTVRAIRDAILRPGGDPGPAVRLLEAEVNGTGGRPDTGALVALQSAPGRTAAAATIAAIEAIVAEGGTVDMGMLIATEALVREYMGAEEEPALRHALALAQATQGDFDAAFGHDPTGRADQSDLWALLAARGTEGAVMTHALRDGPMPQVPVATTQAMARRLIDMGFPDAAIDWLDAGLPVEGEELEQRRLLAAEAELRRRDPLAAIGLVAGIASPEAATLRNEALLQLGTPEPLERLRADSSAAGDLRQRAARMARDWSDVADEGPEVWRNAALLLDPSPVSADAPPLARAQALLDESTRAREALQSLIDATAPPPEADTSVGGS